MGYEFTEEEIQKVYERFLLIADKMKTVKEDDIRALVEDTRVHVTPEYELVHVSVVSGGAIPSAVVRLSHNGEEYAGRSRRWAYRCCI